MNRFLPRFKQRKTIRSIISITIDLNREIKENNPEFVHGKTFLGKGDRKFAYEEVEDECKYFIENKLKKKLRRISELDIIDIEIIDEYEGSIEFVVGIILGLYSNIANLSGFLDSVKLINKQARKLINRNLKERFGDNFDVTTTTEYPNTDRHMYIEDILWGKGRGGFPMIPSDQESRRDVFFWYLFISNIVLVSIIAMLVYKAVVTQYGF